MLQTMLASEPERLLPYITHEQDRILDAVVEYLRPLLAQEAEAGRVRPGVDLDRATRYVATMGLSVMATPGRVVIEIVPDGRIGFDAEEMFRNSPAGPSRTEV